MNFTVYKSSAGSGKTYTLVKEYLKLALGKGTTTAYKNILAITFTNKAASEMKERILSALKTLSEHKKDQALTPLQNDLIRDLGISEDIICQRSALVLESMLHNYSDLSISTIDKFTHKIVRTFAHDLRLPVNFHIEMDSEKLLQQAIDLLIAKVGSDEKLTLVLQEFVEKKADDEKNWEIEKDLISFSKNLLKEDGLEYIKKLKHLTIDDFLEIRNQLKDFITDYEGNIENLGTNGLNIITKAGISIEDLAGGKTGSIAKYFSYLSDKRMEQLKPTPTVQKNIAEDKWTSGKCKKEDKANIEAHSGLMKSAYLVAQTYIEKHQESYILYSLIFKNIYGLTLLNEIENLVEEIKKENNTIHISEFNKRIAAIVINEPAPFVYERLGERYHHFLIDEFQDTSVLQWQNLLPLVDNSLATGNFNMVVGDGKQSIYRWRGGEVKQFANLPQVLNPENNPLIAEREASLVRNHKPEFLKKNYRSKAEVIDFNNRFFKSASQNLDPAYQIIYDNLEQEYHPENTGGYVEIEFINSPTEVLSIKDLHCIKTFEAIKNALTDGFSYQDITILSRTNKQGSLIATYLINQDVPVISSESLLLGNNKDIQFLIAAISWLNDPENKINIALMVEYIFDKYNQSTVDFHQTLSGIFNSRQKNSFETFLATYDFKIEKKALLKQALYELCEGMIRTFKLDQRPDIYLQFFLESVYQYSNKNDNNISNFLSWWEDKGQNKSVVIPQGINAVNIMTIHKSKGLEFPVVIFPFATWDQKNSAENIWVNMDREEIPLPSALLPINKSLENTSFQSFYGEETHKSLLDNINILYVALTRPEYRLYILTNSNRAQSISSHFVKYLKNADLWNENQSIYCFGEPCKKTEKQKSKTQESYIPMVNISEDWSSKINISKQAGKLWDLENQTASSLKYGTLMHTALSRIMNETDLPEALSTMLGEGLITESEALEINEKISLLVNHPQIKEFYAPGLLVKNEAEILLEDGSIYRPDRVIISGNQATVIDYKTGKEKQKHHQQLNLYGNLLNEMGYKNIKKYLIYTEELKLEEIA